MKLSVAWKSVDRAVAASGFGELLTSWTDFEEVTVLCEEFCEAKWLVEEAVAASTAEGSAPTDTEGRGPEEAWGWGTRVGRRTPAAPPAAVGAATVDVPEATAAGCMRRVRLRLGESPHTWNGLCTHFNWFALWARGGTGGAGPFLFSEPQTKVRFQQTHNKGLY